MTRDRSPTTAPPAAAPVLEFAGNRLDLAAGELWRSGRRVPVRRKVWEVLCFLVSRPGRLVTKDELLAAVWPGVTVNEEAVARHVRDARRALGDTDKPATCIEIEYGRGFRFIAPVRREADPTSEDRSTADADGADILGDVERLLGVHMGATGITPMVGRGDVLAAVAAALRRTPPAATRLVEVVGDAGMGKTRLVAAAVEQALAAGFAVLVGRCFEGEGRPPFWPWVQALRLLLRRFPVDQVRSGLGEQGAALAQILPEFGPLVATGTDAEHARLRLFDAVGALLRHAGRRQPLLLVLDDVHWADAASIALLQAMLYEPGVPLLALVTRRPDEPDVTVGVGGILDRLRRDGVGERHVLHGLDLDDATALLAGDAGAAIDADLARDLWQRTGGNPYFLRELWRHVEDARLPVEVSTASDDGAIPEGVRSTLARRTARLSAAAQSVLAAAAVQGVEFQLATVARAVDRPEAEVLEAIEEAVVRGMIEELPGPAGRFRFDHALTAEVLRAGLSGARRARLHAKIGRAIESEARDAAGRVAEIAFHLTRAADPELADEAIAYAFRAAREADAACAYESAALHLERALAVVEAFGRADEEVALRRRYAILLELAECWERGGDGSRMRARVAEAVAAAHRLGDHVLAARAALVGGSLWHMAEATTIRHLEETLAALGDAEPALRAQVQARLARELYFATDTRGRREELCREAQRLARDAGDERALGLVLVDCLEALFHMDALSDLERLADRLYAVAAMGDDRRLRMEAHSWRIALSLQRGRLADAAAEIERLRGLAAEARRPRFVALGHTFAASLAMAYGDFARAEHEVRAAARLNQRIHAYHSSWIAFMQLFTIRREQGRADELRSDDDTLRPPSSDDAGFAFFARAAWWQIPFALSEQGRFDEARQSFAERMERLDELPMENARNSRVASLLSLVDVCAASGDAAAAARLLPLVRPYEGQWVGIGFGGFCGASVHNALGMLAGVLGQRAAARAHFDTALAEHDREGAVMAQARTLHNYARMLLTSAGDDADDARHARTLIERGLDLARRHGLVASQRKLERLLG